VRLVTTCNLLLLLVVAGCGGGGGGSATETLYSSPDWGVVLKDGKAEVLHVVDGKPVVDTSGDVKIEILGPKPGEHASNPPQVAIAMHSTTPLVESALWVDGFRLLEKGGGTPTNGTIYGAPNRLDPGTHTAVGYARTATSGSAVAWTFTVS
jgi:hypothetical protein